MGWLDDFWEDAWEDTGDSLEWLGGNSGSNPPPNFYENGDPQSYQEYIAGGYGRGDQGANIYDYQRRNFTGFDPVTGAPMGFYGTPRNEHARDLQFGHDVAVAEIRARLGRDASNKLEQARSTLSSYRPGTQAALASGIYQNEANALLQRAQMTQPLDLLSDLRRHEGFQADQAASKAQTANLIGGVVQAVGTVVGAIYGGGAGAVAGAALGGLTREALGASQGTAPQTAGQGGASGATGGFQTAPATVGAPAGAAEAQQQAAPSGGTVQPLGGAMAAPDAGQAAQIQQQSRGAAPDAGQAGQINQQLRRASMGAGGGGGGAGAMGGGGAGAMGGAGAGVLGGGGGGGYGQDGDFSVRRLSADTAANLGQLAGDAGAVIYAQQRRRSSFDGIVNIAIEQMLADSYVRASA